MTRPSRDSRHSTWRKTLIPSLLLLVFSGNTLSAQQQGYARLDNDTLVMGNSCMERRFAWNGGNLCTTAIINKQQGIAYPIGKSTADMVLTQSVHPGSNASLEVEKVPGNGIHEAYVAVNVRYSMDSLQVHRVFRIYDDTPAIACDTWVRGRVAPTSNGEKVGAVDKKNIESAHDMVTLAGEPTIDGIQLLGKHWHGKVVELVDVTDWNDNLVRTNSFISYRKASHRGNFLLLNDGETPQGLFFIKESPNPDAQIAYGGADFISNFGAFTVTGLGVSPEHIVPDKWTRLNGCVLGVTDGSDLSAMTALRSYQKKLRKFQPLRDEMVMMNTWGDRSQDSRVNEQFCLRELDYAHQMGIDVYQLDDGWQTGKSPNSKVAKGSFENIWARTDYWEPDTVKFPHGLQPVVDKATRLGMKIGLWFNPSIQNEFADWEHDANAIIGLHQKYGICHFKIDGIRIATKTAEENLRKLFDCVMEATHQQVVFNLDVTAGRRFGFLTMNEYGNIFLENRYTDWGNYYPYRTLRSLWQLSHYVQPERLQIEFLNKWRNADKYPANDAFAPQRYDFDYVFAIAMMGEPLAWMEATGLPQEAIPAIKPFVEKYKTVRNDIHRGFIFPIGEEPSGRSWTGFQSITSDHSGYFLVFREDNDSPTGLIHTWLPANLRIRLEPVCGSGTQTTAETDENGNICFTLPAKNSFALYRYDSYELTQEFIFQEHAPTPSCHASTIVELADGSLLAAWFGGTRESADDVDIWCARKEVDGGWSRPTVIAHDARHACWNPVLFQPREGQLLLFYKTGPKVKEWKGHIVRSDDQGASWKSDKVVKEGMFGAIKNKPVMLADGRIIAPSSDERNGWSIHFEISDNRGKTWRKVGPVNAPDSAYVIQPSILIHPDGSLQAVARSQNGRLAQTFSRDNGDTWSDVSFADFPQNNSGLDAVTLHDGRFLLVCNPVGNTPGKRGGPRSPLSVFLSDDGVEWDKLLDLETQPGEYSYPAVIQGADNTIHITYTWQRKYIRHARLVLP